LLNKEEDNNKYLNYNRMYPSCSLYTMTQKKAAILVI
jgi:hypothetical protein